MESKAYINLLYSRVFVVVVVVVVVFVVVVVVVVVQSLQSSIIRLDFSHFSTKAASCSHLMLLKRVVQFLHQDGLGFYR